MDTENDNQSARLKRKPLLIIVLILMAGLLGWLLGQFNGSPNNAQVNETQPNKKNDSVGNEDTSGTDVKSLARYTLPDGWKETVCPDRTNSVFVVPRGEANVDCDDNPISRIKISVDPANNTDCSQLQNVQNVSKHICISEFINGKKSLKAETIYNKASSYKNPTVVNAYYIDIGKAVIKVEYTHDPNNNEFQVGFEQLAKSIQAK